MEKNRKYIISIVFALKVLLCIGFLVGLFLRFLDQVTFWTSGFPEHDSFAKKNGRVILGMIPLLIPLMASLVVDFRELKKESLRRKWYLVTTGLVLGYFLICRVNSHYFEFIISVFMTLLIIWIIRQQHVVE
jgi:H+/Cl- antiporter ClcA